MPDNLYLGLDNTQPNALRAVYVLTERPFTTSVLKWQRCKDLERFQKLIENFPPTVVAVSTSNHDPWGAISWLSQRRLPIKQYPAHQLLDPFDEIEMPQLYRRAYCLAYQAVYDCEAPRAVEALWDEIHWAKLSLDRMSRDLDRLATIEIPF
jgi:hypothetical protein